MCVRLSFDIRNLQTEVGVHVIYSIRYSYGIITKKKKVTKVRNTNITTRTTYYCTE